MEKSGARSFHDLHVFKQARELVNLVYDATESGPIRKDYAFVDQMRRAALSIVSNIAEGFERGSDVDFARALYIAKGSNGELRAHALIASDRKYLPKPVSDQIEERTRKLGAGLANLIAYLKRSAARRSTK